MDTAGNVYISDANSRVMKMVAGSNTQVELPVAGLNGPGSVAIGGAGNVYVADLLNSRVLKLPAGSNIQVELPFTGLKGLEATSMSPSPVATQWCIKVRC